jgi:hypothetical protein
MWKPLGLALAVSSLALSGCSVGTAASVTGGTTTPPPPSSSAPVQRWEHYCVYPNNHAAEILRAAGELGWELVAVAMTTQPNNSELYCFKRPLLEGAPATRGPGPTVPDEEFPAPSPTVEPASPNQP